MSSPGNFGRARSVRASSSSIVERIEPRLMLAADLFKDVNARTLDSEPADFTQLGSAVFFTADAGTAGPLDPDGRAFGLFKTDGTTGGTTLVRTFNIDSPTVISSRPVDLTPLASGKLLFYAADGAGFEPWVSDGTTAGTVRLKDINPGAGHSALQDAGPGLPQITRIGNTAYFMATTGGGSARRIWSTDGTGANTLPVPVAPGEPSPFGPHTLATAGGKLYVGATDAAYNQAVWVLGASGLEKIADVPMFDAVNVGGVLHFSDGTALRRSDGTAAGTTLLRDFGELGAVEDLTASDGQLLFVAYDEEAGTELWRSDGTPAGTTRVVDLQAGPDSSSPLHLTTVGARTYFVATATDEQTAIWRTDGTAGGTTRVTPVFTADPLRHFNHLRAGGQYLYFTASNDAVDAEVFRIDTAAASPVAQAVTDFTDNLGHLLGPGPVTVTTAGAFFSAQTLATGREPYRTTGTPAGITLLKDLVTKSGGSDVQSQASSDRAQFGALPGGKFVFGADNAATGRELWVSDGTPGGTTLLKDIFPGEFASDPNYFTPVGSLVYFFARENFDAGDTYFRLWKTDGTAAGTVRVSNVPVDVTWPFMIASGSTVYFNADDGTTGVELWKTTGTAAGTSRVADLAPGWAGSNITDGAVLGGQLYLSGRTADGSAPSLFKSDGTAAGTSVLGTFATGDGDAPGKFAALNGVLYFTAKGTSAAGRRLWRTDGTVGGTTWISDAVAIVGAPVAFNGALYFAGNGGDGAGVELWRSDGDTTGTTRVKDVVDGPASSNPDTLRVVGDKLLFRTAGGKLFRTDGTDAGTAQVTDVVTVATPDAVALGSKLFFHGNGSGNGAGELWATDGTAAGTTLVKDIFVGTSKSLPATFAAIHGRVYFTADDGKRGRELWAWTSDTAATEVIVDNTAAVLTGTWSASTSSPGYYGSNYLHDGKADKGAKSVQWTPTLPSAGTYAVYARWISGADRPTAAPYDVTHAGGTTTVLKDQRTGGASWQLLGTWSFNTGAGGNVVLRTTDTTGFVIADAVRFVKQAPPTTVADVIADNGAATKTGTWTSSTRAPGYYGADYLHDGNTGKGSKSVTWATALPSAGTYRVYARWIAGSDRATNAKYTVTHATGATSVLKDQRTNGGVWVLLGEYTFGTTGKVTLTNAGTTGYVIADAVRFSRV